MFLRLENQQMMKSKIICIGGTDTGNHATGALATLYMVHWVRIFWQKLSEAAANSPSFSIYLSQVYVDDKNISCEALPLGSRLINGKIQIVEEEIANDNDIPADKQGCKKAGFFVKSPAGWLKLVKTGFYWPKLAKIFSK